MLTQNSILFKNEDVLAWRIYDDRGVIVDLRNREINVLNLVGAKIWFLADGKNTLRDITRLISSEFDCSIEEAEKDCTEFINSIAEKGLVLISEKGAIDGRL